MTPPCNNDVVRFGIDDGTVVELGDLAEICTDTLPHCQHRMTMSSRSASRGRKSKNAQGTQGIHGAP